MQSNARAGTRVCLFFRTHPIPELRIFRCLGHAPCVKAVLSESVDGINFAKSVLPPINCGDGARYRYRSCGTATPRPPDINVALAGRSPICEIYSYPTPPHRSQAAPRNTSLILGERGAGLSSPWEEQSKICEIHSVNRTLISCSGGSQLTASSGQQTPHKGLRRRPPSSNKPPLAACKRSQRRFRSPTLLSMYEAVRGRAVRPRRRPN